MEIDRFALNGSAGERVYSANGYALKYTDNQLGAFHPFVSARIQLVHLNLGGFVVDAAVLVVGQQDVAIGAVARLGLVVSRSGSSLGGDIGLCSGSGHRNSNTYALYMVNENPQGDIWLAEATSEEGGWICWCPR